ncbi:hypothetical protein RHGRI_001458 [Rhododendron griersonianum]|uniref:Uncharacterized protein n=1 Tax=Rhododendron griersonianum TaxID=479676 RepID=A0AAV6LK76_9ERIC|nr:hypothetical protein RHGRI_001458 [Rhododendron griersonianum]
MILVKVADMERGKEFYVSVIYGANGNSDRRQLWGELRNAKLSIGTAAWIQLGDYNVVRKPAERLMGFSKAKTYTNLTPRSLSISVTPALKL